MISTVATICIAGSAYDGLCVLFSDEFVVEMRAFLEPGVDGYVAVGR
jgi:hypothetical protein